MVNNKKIVLVSGYGWSGSGLLIDILKSLDEFYHFPIETRFIKDKNGLIDLYNSKNSFNYGITLEKFNRLCLILARKNFIKYGMNYDLNSNNSFTKIYKNFVNNISEINYLSDAFVFNYENNFFQNILWKFYRKIGLNYRFKKYYIRPENEFFKKEIQSFINNFCESLTTKNYVILDQAIDPADWKEFSWMFTNAKLIVVDRDPRDIYVDYKKSKDVLFDPQSFIEYFKKSRNNNSCDSSNVLNLRFEDLINNYDFNARKIISFLEIKNDNNFSNYDISKSMKNIGIHKNYEIESDINFIEQKLKRFCI